MSQPICSVLARTAKRLFRQFQKRRNISERERLLRSLNNQIVHVPNLKPCFSEWPINVSPQLEALRIEMNTWLESIVQPGKTLDALKKSDFGLFGAAWWPHATLERLVTLTSFSVWLFMWDDEIDNQRAPMGTALSSARTFKDETLAYIRYSLGLQEEDPKVSSPIILSFARVGDGLRGGYTTEQNQRVYDEMVFFIQMSEKEQALRLSGIIPTASEYWEYRLGSSAVEVSLATNEYSWGDMCLPSTIFDDPDMKLVRKCTNTTTSAVNDLYSLKKEIAHSATDSLIPILYYRTNDIQMAVDEAIFFINSELRLLDKAEKRLTEKYRSEDKALEEEICKYIDGCKYAFIGNWLWSLERGRYHIGKADAFGDICFKLTGRI